MSQSNLRSPGVLVAVFGLLAVLVVAGGFMTGPVAQASALAQNAPAAPGEQPVAIYFFWGDGCPHCAAAKPFLAELTQRYPNVELRAYEVWYVQANQALFQRMATAHGFEPTAVPTILIGDQHWVGYSDLIRDAIEATVAACSTSGCRDAGLGVIPGIPTPAPVAPQATDLVQDETATVEAAGLLAVPFLGTLDLSHQSLAVSTALIAFVDGFNPCSLWVLSVLLALTLHTGSRRKVLLVGLVFLTVTSLVYMLFITGLFTMFSVVSFVGWIQVVVALVALFFAAVNIKDYFWYKEGISFTIADEKKPGIYRRMRNVLEAGNSTWGLIGATVVLSAGVSLVEFSCTAGFPVLWTNLLIAQEATAMTFGLLLLLYMLIYQIDELGIFLAAVFTLKASRLEEKQGRILKLVGGMLMLTLAVVMLVNPAWMNTLSTSLWVFAAAFGLTGGVLLAHRVLLPRMGIYIGTEMWPPNKQKSMRRQRA